MLQWIIIGGLAFFGYEWWQNSKKADAAKPQPAKNVWVPVPASSAGETTPAEAANLAVDSGITFYAASDPPIFDGEGKVVLARVYAVTTGAVTTSDKGKPIYYIQITNSEVVGGGKLPAGAGLPGPGTRTGVPVDSICTITG